jgi:hypothetical protein
MGLCVGVLALLESPDWVLAIALSGLAYAVVRVGGFLISPPWQLRMVPSAGAVELRSHTRLVRTPVTVVVADIESVGPVEPYGSNQWDGARAAAKLGRLLGMSEIAIRAEGRLHRVIGREADLAVPLVESLRRHTV